MIGYWLLFCVCFTMALAGLFIVPLARHGGLPRRKKWLISICIFLLLVPAGLLLYTLLGVPSMVLF